MAAFTSTTVENKNNGKDTHRGAAAYHPWLLSFYDWLVLGIFSSYAWRCPLTSVLLPFFRAHVSDTHLEIGVGTGCLVADSMSAIVSSSSSSSFSDKKNKVDDDDRNNAASITLLDLNPHTLDVARARLSKLIMKKHRYSATVQTLQHDIFLPLPPTDDDDDPSTKFNGRGRRYKSISLFYLLHCLPGPPERKIAIFDHLRRNLVDDGVVYGTTVLGKGVRHNFLGKTLMAVYNAVGIFDNREDGEVEVTERLKRYFDKVETRVVGVVLMFECRGPKLDGAAAAASATRN